MAVESAADLAAFFEVDEFAEAATYQPMTGSPVAVTVITDRGKDVGALGQLGARRERFVVQLRVAEVAEPMRGDLVIIGAETFKVAGTDRDFSGAIWLLDLQRQS